MNGERPSLASYLQSLGYETVATHPYYATGWNRDKVYPWLGFEQSILKISITGHVLSEIM
ncbi:MAG: sulfatase-like hydrolase/transferase [Roseburia hominis]